MDLLPNPRGDYHFLTGIEPYSSGVRADPGYEVCFITLHQPVPWRAGFARVDAYLQAAGRERSALCAIALRSPAPFTRQGFIDFNQGYCAVLEEWGLLVEGKNPIARTNVAPMWNPPAEPSLYAFALTMPAEEDTPETFVVAGAGELGPGSLLEAPVIRADETSPEALREKAQHVMRIMERRLRGLGVDWSGVTATEVYTRQPMDTVFGPCLLDQMGGATHHGLRWHHSRPPIDVLEFEMDCRGVRTEFVL